MGKRDRSEWPSYASSGEACNIGIAQGGVGDGHIIKQSFEPDGVTAV